MIEQGWRGGRIAVEHRRPSASILAQAFRLDVAMTVHPSIGYDIVAIHPIFNGSVIGRAAEWDYRLFGGSVQGLDGGVVLSVGSAIMGPQVFEKSLSCANNLRLQGGGDTIRENSARADMTKLCGFGHAGPATNLEDGVRRAIAIGGAVSSLRNV